MAAYPADLTNTRRTGLVWLIPLLSALMFAVTLWCYAHNGPLRVRNTDLRLDVFQAAVGLSYPLIGAFILYRRPGNVIGWIFCLMGLFSALYGLSVQYPAYALLVLQRNLPLTTWLTWVENWAWYVPIVMFTALVMLYPTGRPLGRNWGRVLVLVLAMIPLIILLTWIYLWPYRGVRLVLPPTQLSANQLKQIDALRHYLYILIGVPMLIGFPCAVTALILRLRRAAPVEQQQIKWFLYLGSLFSLALLLYEALQLLTQSAAWVDQIIWNGIMPVLAVGLPVTVGFAILRYRLFDIDLIIRRTLIYTLLTLVLAVDYLVSVIVLQALLRTVLGQSSSIAVVISTLIIAALFNPVRQRVQRLIDRRFYRGHYNPEQVLSRLSSAIQTEVDLEMLTAAVLQSVDDAIHPESKSLWLKK